MNSDTTQSQARCQQPIVLPFVAWVSAWNRPRVLVIAINGDEATVITEYDRVETRLTKTLETREKWLAECRIAAADSNLTGIEVERYISRGLGDFEPGPRWRSALGQNDKAHGTAGGGKQTQTH